VNIDTEPSHRSVFETNSDLNKINDILTKQSIETPKMNKKQNKKRNRYSKSDFDYKNYLPNVLIKKLESKIRFSVKP
jgi:hypothetical protein